MRLSRSVARERLVIGDGGLVRAQPMLHGNIVKAYDSQDLSQVFVVGFDAGMP